MTLYSELSTAYKPGYVERAGLKQEHLWLAERCVQTHSDAFWVREQLGRWVVISGKRASFNAVCQNWLGGPHNVTADDVKKFMSFAPVVDGGMKVPTSTALVIEFQGGTFINTWLDTIVKPDFNAINEPLVRSGLELFYRMLRESLCSKPGAKTLDEMINIAKGCDPAELEYRFLLSWLAAPLQQIGRNMQTNAWLLGELGGSGKGTLNSIMGAIYGADHARLINCADVEKGGWTDVLEGALFVCLNEINPGRGFDWNSFIKQNSCEESISIRKRNHHPHPALNFANWVFNSNNEGPACLDSHDRRNALVATTDSTTTAQLGQQMRDWLAQHRAAVPRFLGALVALLHNHPVDEALIRKAPETLLKAEVQEATSRDGIYLYWLINDADYPRDRWCLAHVLLEYYERFSHQKLDPRGFGGQLSKLARKGRIERRRQNGSGTQPSLYRISASKYPVYAEADATDEDAKVTPKLLRIG